MFCVCVCVCVFLFFFVFTGGGHLLVVVYEYSCYVTNIRILVSGAIHNQILSTSVL